LGLNLRSGVSPAYLDEFRERIMASLRYLRFFAIGFSLVAALYPTVAKADCPEGSGIEFPFLTNDEFECQKATVNGTLDYLNSFISARQDCFKEMLNGSVRPGDLDCLAPITDTEPGTTGDPDIDRRLRVAEAQLTSRVLGKCTGVALERLGFPGFCEDPTPEDPYNSFDHLNA
jgi:hypothetical protein